MPTNSNGLANHLQLLVVEENLDRVAAIKAELGEVTLARNLDQCIERLKNKRFHAALFPLSGESITETHISTITDSIILLRYVELQGEMRRAITVLKMRGSWHDKRIREYNIDGGGMHIQESFRGVSGILSGKPSHSIVDEKTHLARMFSGGSGDQAE